MHLSICLLCTAFDIGGAETHILTLAEALAREGHRVCVVSAGGMYAERGGTLFRHVTLPLHKKRNLLSCLFRLRRLFRKERFDVVHSHTRFTSFLCRMLGVRFVTTAHWVFSTRFPYRRLSFWGEGSLAVSADIRDYLRREYGVQKERIFLTVNGIDCERFYARKSDDGVYRICLCSRLDRDRSDAAHLLCDALAAIGHRFRFSATIVGDGDDFDAVKKRAEGVNRLLKERRIRCVGATDAVEKELASADIFVGVSRAALEAMAAECAVILAGNEGYSSVFSVSRAAKDAATNFCCRGAPKASAQALTNDLSYLLSLPKEVLHAMGKENRTYVQTHYSAERMAKDALSLYDTVRKRKAVLCGYYGFGNVGDALMHRALSARLWREGYGEVLTLSRKRFSLSSLYAVWKGYDFFLGGGNLLQDESSLRSLRFYSTLARFAHWRGCRVSLLSSGFGAFVRGGEKIAKRVLSLADAVECRTAGDLSLARSLGARNASLSHDAVLDLPLGIRKRDAGRVMLALRAPRDEGERLSFFSYALRLRALYGKERLFVFAMHPADVRYLRSLSEHLGVPFMHGTEKDFIGALCDCFAVYAGRLHAAVCALRVGVPAFLYERDEKSRFFAGEVEKAASSLSLPPSVKLFSLSDRIERGTLPSPLPILRVCEALRAKG